MHKSANLLVLVGIFSLGLLVGKFAYFYLGNQKARYTTAANMAYARTLRIKHREDVLKEKQPARPAPPEKLTPAAK